MKKFIGVIVLITVFLISPFRVSASEYGIENFNMHVTVLENGDLYVREAFAMNGSYSGMDREINFRNSYVSAFTGTLEDFNGSDIYNGSDIELVQIRGIPFTNSISFKEMESSGTKFSRTYSADKGDYGVYKETQWQDGVIYRIFNPSSKKNIFYLEYLIKNMAVEHEDIAEVGWNIFNENFRESIHYLTVDIYIPGNKEILRAFGHGPLIGETELDGKEHIHLTMEGLEANTAIDTRFVFDKSVLSNPSKKTNIEALDKIIEVETKRAEIANQEREEARRQVEEELQHQRKMATIFGGAGILWFIGLVFLICHVYKKHDKEYESTFKTQYYRDFPADYNPSTVGYLFHQNVSNNDLSACLLNLIYKKVITFEKISSKDYKLVYHENNLVMTQTDQKLIKLIFRTPEITLQELKRKAKSGYSSFIRDFTEWKNSAIVEAKNENFFESKIGIKIKASLYAFLGIVLSICSIAYVTVPGIILLIVSIGSLIYFLAFTKKTPKGIEHYLKWKALRKFMQDFGTMDKKELPEIVLWEKYLVYAVSLGCADKLAKTMELRIAEFNDTEFINFNYNIHMMRDMMVFNHIVSSSINSAVNSAYSAQSVANSSNSSGSGFGGGFSGGGGSFGGGSGGGRF